MNLFTPFLLISSSLSSSISLSAYAPTKGEEFKIIATVDINIDSPLYSWKKDGIDLVCSSLEYVIPSFDDDDFGTYTFTLVYKENEEEITKSKDIVIDHYQLHPKEAPNYLIPLIAGVGVLGLTFLVLSIVFFNKKKSKSKKKKK